MLEWSSQVYSAGFTQVHSEINCRESLNASSLQRHFNDDWQLLKTRVSVTPEYFICFETLQISKYGVCCKTCGANKRQMDRWIYDVKAPTCSYTDWQSNISCGYWTSAQLLLCTNTTWLQNVIRVLWNQSSASVTLNCTVALMVKTHEQKKWDLLCSEQYCGNQRGLTPTLYWPQSLQSTAWTVLQIRQQLPSWILQVIESHVQLSQMGGVGL